MSQLEALRWDYWQPERFNAETIEIRGEAEFLDLNPEGQVRVSLLDDCGETVSGSWPRTEGETLGSFLSRHDRVLDQVVALEMFNQTSRALYLNYLQENRSWREPVLSWRFRENRRISAPLNQDGHYLMFDGQMLSTILGYTQRVVGCRGDVAFSFICFERDVPSPQDMRSLVDWFASARTRWYANATLRVVAGGRWRHFGSTQDLRKGLFDQIAGSGYLDPKVVLDAFLYKGEEVEIGEVSDDWPPF